MSKEKELICQNCGLVVGAVYIVPKEKSPKNKDIKVCQDCHNVIRPEIKNV